MFNLEEGMLALQRVYLYGLQVEDFAMPFSITELLCQSYGEVIRLFPAWPRDKGASFTTAGGGWLPGLFQPGKWDNWYDHHCQHHRRSLPGLLILGSRRAASYSRERCGSFL